LSALAGRYWGEDVKVGEADAKASGNTIMEAPASVLKEFEAMTGDMEDEWLESVKDRNVDAKKALMELREIARSYQ
jgi:hypothetical protein